MSLEIDEAHSQLNKLNEALESGDLSGARRIIHTFIGIMDSIYASLRHKSDKHED